jgi:hypothetical protein
MVVKDNHPAIMVKDAILARSGIYTYTAEEIRDIGFPVDKNKQFCTVYRPPSVIVKAKDKFAFVVVTRKHAAADTEPGNFHEQADGVVGDSIDVVPMQNGDIALKGRIAFYTKDVADFFESGNKETSAQYHMKLAASSDPVRDGYDYVMTDITSVNSLAIVPLGRGGRDVRVLDSIARNKSNGGVKMIGGFLSFLGIGKTKDENFKFSDVLFGGIARVKEAGVSDLAGVEKAVGDVMSYVTALGESEARSVLAGAVSDCLKNADAVLAKRDVVTKKIDELYGKCMDAQSEAVKRILDAGSDPAKDADKKDDDKKDSKDADKKDDDKKEGGVKDVETVVAAAMDKAFSKVGETLDAKIEAAVKKALNVDPPAAVVKDSSVVPAAGYTGEDASYLVRGVFGAK